MTINIDFSDVSADLKASEIFSIITDKDIYEKYSNEAIDLKRKIKCLFHEDNNPSLGFYSSNNQLKFKCFGCGKQGDSIEFVKELYGLSYPQVLTKLTKDFGIKATHQPVEVKVMRTDKVLSKESDTVLIPILRPFNAVDEDYWSKFCIPLDLLLEYDISACERVYKVKDDKYSLCMEYTKDNPIYCYNINNKYKIYRPLDTTGYKWLNTTTNTDLQGMKQLPSKGGHLLIVTSSMKDVLVLKVLGYNAIALESEGAKFNVKLLDYLHSVWNHIIIFYDGDNPGIEYGKKASQDYALPFVYIDGYKYKAKDISDYIKLAGLNEAAKLMRELIGTPDSN